MDVRVFRRVSRRDAVPRRNDSSREIIRVSRFSVVFRITDNGGFGMQPRTLTVVVTLGVSVALYYPRHAEAQAMCRFSLAAVQLDGAGTTRQVVASGAQPRVASERDKVLRLGMISGTMLGAAGGGAMVHHICADNEPDFGVLCPLGVVSLFAGGGALGGILTGAVIAPTVT